MAKGVLVIDQTIQEVSFQNETDKFSLLGCRCGHSRKDLMASAFVLKDRIIDIRKMLSSQTDESRTQLEFESLRATTELPDVMNGDFKQERRTENADYGTILFEKPWKDRLEETAK